MMVRVFLSRYTPGLQPGQGASIGWEKGERCRVISGPDEGRTFVVDSEGMSHAQCKPGDLVREGWFEDNPTRKVAKAECVLWFADDSWSKTL